MSVTPQDQTVIDQAAAPTVDTAVNAVVAQEVADAAAVPPEPVKEPTLDDMINMSPEELQKLLDAPTDALPVTAPAADTVVAGADTTAAAAPGADTVPGGAKPAAGTHMVPKPRFDEVLESNRKLKEQLDEAEKEKAYLAGVAAGGGKPPAAPTETPQALVAQVDTRIKGVDIALEKRIDEIATAFDEGKILMAEQKRLERIAISNANQLKQGLIKTREDIIRTATTPTKEELAEQIEKHPELSRMTEELVAQNPWLESMPEEMFNDLRDLSVLRLRQQGVPIEATPQSTWDIRLTMATLGRNLKYDTLFAAPPADTPPAPPPAAPAKDPVQSAIEQQRAEKLRLAGMQPPLPTSAGVPAPTDTLAAHGIDPKGNASVDELVALPRSLLEKAAGI